MRQKMERTEGRSHKVGVQRGRKESGRGRERRGGGRKKKRRREEGGRGRGQEEE